MFCDHLVSSYASNYVRSFIRVAKHPERATSSYMHSLNEEKKERKKGERNFQRAMNMYDSPINVSRIHPCYSRIDRVR